MMKKNVKKIFQTLRQTSLNDAERLRVRSELLEFARLNPSAAVEFGTASRWSVSVWLRQLAQPVIVMTMIAVMIVSTGVSYAAEVALPGDWLYAFKVHVNEEVRAAASLTVDAKAAWEARRAERRLEEAERLAEQGRLTRDAEDVIEKNFQKHTEKISKIIEKMEVHGLDQSVVALSSNLEASLTVHDEVLSDLRFQPAISSATSVPYLILSHVREAGKNVSDEREAAEAKVRANAEAKVRASAEASLKSAEKKIAQMKKSIDKSESKTGQPAAPEARVRLEAALEALTEGRAKLEAGEYGEAFTWFQNSARFSHEGSLILGIHANTRSKNRVKVAEENTNVSLTATSGALIDDRDTQIEQEKNIEDRESRVRGRIQNRLDEMKKQAEDRRKSGPAQSEAESETAEPIEVEDFDEEETPENGIDGIEAGDSDEPPLDIEIRL